MGKSHYDEPLTYQEQLEQQALFSGIENFLKPNNKTCEYDDMDEVFTSNEIVKLKLDPKSDLSEVKVPKGPITIEEDVHFKRYNKKGHVHKYTEQEMEAIRKENLTTIVHDYSEFDMYHQSDEERAKNDSLIEIRAKLQGTRTSYTKVDQYIEAMRLIVQAWELTEQKENFIYSEEEFFKLVGQGRIFLYGIALPKLRKMDRYDIDAIIRYICNPELDPKDLLPIKEEKKEFDWFEEEDDPDESPTDKAMRLLSPEEAAWINEHEDNLPTIKVHDIKSKYIKGYDNKNFNAKKSKLSKKEKKFVSGLHDLLNKIQSNKSNRRDRDEWTSSWYVTSSMFEPPKKEKDFWDDLYFDGSWTNKNDLMLYDLAIQEELDNQHPVGERYVTNSDKRISEFFKTMEDNGINVIELRRRMNMTDDVVRKQESKKVKRNNKKIEAALIQRISKLNNDPKFKKLVTKAEKAINDKISEY